MEKEENVMTKKREGRGFTLIELLAVIIILGVLLLIAVPSVNRYIKSSRIRTYETNLKRMVDAVKMDVATASYSDSNYTVTESQPLVVLLSAIELERGSNTQSPFSNYKSDKSFILVTKGASGYQYMVSALDNSGYGTPLVNIDNLEITERNANDVASLNCNGNICSVGGYTNARLIGGNIGEPSTETNSSSESSNTSSSFGEDTTTTSSSSGEDTITTTTSSAH